MNASVVSIQQPQVASLSSSAVLVNLTIGVWTAQKKAANVARDAEMRSGATGKALDAKKFLLGDCLEHKELTNYRSMVRGWYLAHTLPWDDSGLRLLPASYMFEFNQTIADFERGFYDRRDTLLNAYSYAIQAAQFSMGSLFSHDDYPDPEVLKDKFYFRLAHTPVPEVGDFRVDIGVSGMQEAMLGFKAQADRIVQDVARTNWERLHDVLSTMSNQLRVKGAGGAETTGKLYDSTLESLLQLCDMLTDFNLTNDPELEKIRRDLKMTMQGVNLDELKKDDRARLSVKAEVDDILSKISF